MMYLQISIHSLRGEGDVAAPDTDVYNLQFQSTPSVGRETFSGIIKYGLSTISIHSLRGEGDKTTGFADCRPVISIHSLRGEGDGRKEGFMALTDISIHSLRGEGDRASHSA